MAGPGATDCTARSLHWHHPALSQPSPWEREFQLPWAVSGLSRATSTARTHGQCCLPCQHPPVSVTRRAAPCATGATDGHHGSHQHLLGMPPAPSWVCRYHHKHPAPCSTSGGYRDGSACPVLPSPTTSVPVTSTLRVPQAPRNSPTWQPLAHSTGERNSAWVPGLPSPSRFLQLNQAIEALEEEAFWCGTLFFPLHAALALRKWHHNCF